MNLSLQDIASIVGSILGPMGTIIGFFWSNFNKKIKQVDKKIDHLKDEVTSIDKRLTEEISNVESRLEQKINNLEQKLSKEIKENIRSTHSSIISSPYNEEINPIPPSHHSF